MTPRPASRASAIAVCILLAPSLLLASVLIPTGSFAAVVPASPSMWLKYSGNPVLDIGTPGSFDSKTIQSTSVVRSGTKYFIYYNGDAGSGNKVGLATSSDGKSFTKHAANPIILNGASASVIKDGPTFKMWYVGDGGVRHATSTDGMVWTEYLVNPVLTNGTAGSWDAAFWDVDLIRDGDIYKMWYSGKNNSDIRIGYATSPDGIRWTRYAGNPVLVQEESWESVRVLSPCVLRVSGEYQMWYSAYNGQKTGICFANSTDGITWLKYPGNPLMPASVPWEASNKLCPVVLYDGRDYRMWYTGSDASGHTQIGYAESTTIGPVAPAPLSPADNAWTDRSSPVFSWQFGPAGNPDAQSAFHLQLDDSLDFASVLLDTGKIPSSDRTYTMTEALADGTYYWRVRAWDDSADESAWSGIRTTRIDTATPAIDNFTINEGAAFTDRSTVRLSINASDPEPGSGLADMRYTVNGLVWAPWEPYRKELTVELSGSDREWTVSVQVRDRMNNTSPGANASILVDTTAPSQTGLKINGGAEFTNIVSVVLAVSSVDPSPATGLAGMAFSNDGASWTLWEPYGASRAYDLTAGDGQKRVQVKVRDRAGNVGAPSNATILLDTIPPVASVVPMPILSEQTNFTVGWTALDALSGIGGFDVEYRENGGPWTAWLAKTNLTKASFNGTDGSSYSFRARSSDGAGNTGAFPDSVSNTVRVSIPRPVVTILEPAPSRTMKGKLLSAGTSGHPKAGKQVTLIEVSIDGGSWTCATGTLSWAFQLDTTKLKNGWHNISARSFDGVKYSAVATTDFKVLNKPPSVTDTSMPLMFIAVIVIVIIVVVAILLLLGRGKQPARQAPPGQAPPGQAPPGQAPPGQAPPPPY